MKLGFECEGRLKGLYTLFMDAKEALEFFRFKSLKERALPSGVTEANGHSVDCIRHIYVSDLQNILTGTEKCFETWFDLYLPVTVEVSAIEDRYKWPANVTLMFNISEASKANSSTIDASFWSMFDTDQIKFTRLGNNNNYRVRCLTIQSMIPTSPDEFDGDLEFKVSRANKYRVKA